MLLLGLGEWWQGDVLGHACFPGQHISGHLEVRSLVISPGFARQCLHVYLPCSKASGHVDRMCPVVA